jgi:hypothetical protein
MKEALSSSETWVLTRTTRRNIPEDAVIHTISYLSVSLEWNELRDYCGHLLAYFTSPE